GHWPLPQVMFPKNVTSSEALAPPLGAAQVAPIRPQKIEVWIDVCRGYYDVMGHFDSAFNCSKDTFIYCCGTCHYRFCCPEPSRQLEQDSCKNYDSPDWAKPQTDAMIIPEELGPDPGFDPLKQQSHNTGFVIGGVVVFMVAVAVGIKVVFNKVQQEAIQRELNMPSGLNFIFIARSTHNFDINMWVFVQVAKKYTDGPVYIYIFRFYLVLKSIV
uniref:Shisa family member 7a n=1 Tax=Salarias fasciatus TaxID=181472 RepID=A0A672HTR9_SALFA